MDLKDYIGDRGEKLFSVLITKFCATNPPGPLFHDKFLGEKAEGSDFVVDLVSPTSGHAPFYVQVKATMSGYKGTGRSRKLRANVAKKDVEKLKKLHCPVYVAGIDIVKEKGYLVRITQQMLTGISGIPTRHPLTCHTLRRLWKEVDDYWIANPQSTPKSRFR